MSTAHLFADGGGRELAYVAMTRARESTHVWIVADSDAQAVDDLRRDWESRRTHTWAIDLAPPGWEKRREELSVKELDERARYIALLAAKSEITGQATVGVRAPKLDELVLVAQANLRHALDARADLERGAGVYHDSEAGRAVHDLEQARFARQQAEQDAQLAPRWRLRRAAGKAQALWAERERDAEQRYQLHVIPEIDRLDQAIDTCRGALQQVEAHREQFLYAERSVAELSERSARKVGRLSAHLAIHRNEIDGVAQPPALRSARVLHAQQIRLHPAVEPVTPQARGLGIGM